MDVNKFNQEATDLVIKSNNQVGFVEESVMDKNAGAMRLVADELKTCIEESFDICINQNITAVDNVIFGNFLLDLTKIYYNRLAIKEVAKPTTEEAEQATVALMENLTVDDMKKSLAQSEVDQGGEKSFDEVLVSYDQHSDGIIKDAFKTMSIKKITGDY